ncbi:OprO/OprP family phosphate-selective porin [Capnocytophaga sp. 051621]|uniref:OprO/OprP family phosphate-selective porin n=1 Tax=Capnocytophaga periodontitidis TaxID=2795027 RepID=A0ABS0SRF6_9FLAO|nr:porin [Capnocytophaga periodontitidis]MBI1648062.1 OprO/OprP family phosphate-selective porin [Capnocytophaga periodontitidis]
MKKILLAVSLLIGGIASAQQDLQNQINQLRAEIDQLKATAPAPLSMPENEGEQPIHKKFNMYFNFQGSFDVEKAKDQDMTAKFYARQLRWEVRGDITDRIFYRFRHRLNKSNARASLDNLAKATDMLYAGFRLDDKWTLTAGKMCQAWGGFEFDLNPMNIYEYSDFLENMDNFMLGAMITYAPNENHEFNFQITDVRNDKFADIYGTTSPTISESKAPLTYIFNWNGNLFDNLIQTRWGGGLQSEADGYNNWLLMLGTKLNLPKFQVFFDYMMANEQLDRLKYTPMSGTTLVKDAKYNSFVLKAEYQPVPHWNIFAQGMYETAKSDLPNNELKSIGYFAGVEYLPFEKQDLRFFLAYIGRSREKNNVTDNTNRVSLGLMYRIKAF